MLNLVAFADGQPVGVQSMRGERFAEERTVDTGSWLGRASQGRGLGTEMRAGVLQLAFEGLGARRATSGAIQGNPQSLGVSRKLGYTEIGQPPRQPPRRAGRAPRPRATGGRLRLTRCRSRSAGSTALLPLFGAEP